MPYAQLYFDSSPLRHAGGVAQARLARRRLLHLPVARARGARHHAPVPQRPGRRSSAEAALQSHKASAEEVLHPPERTTVFGDPFAVGRARASGALRAIDAAVLAPYGLRIDSHMGELARRVRPVAAPVPRPAPAGARDAGRPSARRRRRSAARGPLVVTSTVRDKRYQRVLAATDSEATTAYSLHTTGFAFDIARALPQPRPGAARSSSSSTACTARGLIAWVREPGRDPRDRRVEARRG